MRSKMRLGRGMILAAALAAGTVAAQTYPSKPIRLIVPLAPGGPSDILARSMGQKLTESMKQAVIVDNRTGAGGTLGIDLAAKSAPDGYTMLLVAVATYTINASLYPKLPYDPLADLTPVTILAGAPYILVVHPALPVRSVKQLIALAKARPGDLNYSSGGAGTGPHLATEVFKANAGIDVVHIPYKGAGPALNDLVAGQVQFQLANMIASLPLVQSGRLRAIAVSGSQRSARLPEVPTIAESGVTGLDDVGGHMIMVPGATPRVIITRLHQELAKVLQQPEVKARLASEGAEIFSTPPDETAAIIRNDIQKWAKIIRQLKLQSN
ncbi:MAG: tripartite tricarboxylate transporter substrate binding protein [Burkholderiales bacterium]|nr:tripartite tricarboxylate transporter substrate binding protein [Burkholderiales bacterium]